MISAAWCSDASSMAKSSASPADVEPSMATRIRRIVLDLHFFEQTIGSEGQNLVHLDLLLMRACGDATDPGVGCVTASKVQAASVSRPSLLGRARGRATARQGAGR